MTGKITDQDIEKARNVSIASIIGIRHKRQNIKCPLPNHEDGTPSFLLDEDNGYHCFGCGKHGNNAVDFCLDLDPSSSFLDVVKFLSDNY
jgi:DNA primase